MNRSTKTICEQQYARLVLSRISFFVHNRLSFLDIEIIREKDKFTTTIYRKPTLSGIYSNFKSFLPSGYKFGMIYILVYKCFRICSNWTQFLTELTFLGVIFQKNGYPVNFINKCFKKFLNNIHLFK